MSQSGDGQSSYVQRVREETQRYMQSLMKDNEELRATMSTLSDEREELRRQIDAAREEVERFRNEKLRLEQRLSSVAVENHQFAEQYAEVEQQNSNLANLYVATYRLHGTLDRREVIEIINEIIINLVGSEEIAIYELDDDRTALVLSASFGIDESRYGIVSLGAKDDGANHETIRSVVRTGEAWFADASDASNGSSPITACVPLKLDNRVIGAIAIFRLLPQKSGLEPLDHELFDLLSTQAATALYSSSLQEKLGGRLEALA